MIDIHSHVIFGVDDGPSVMDESVKMLEEAHKAGIQCIIATPHFHENVFEAANAAENFYILSDRAAEIGITLLKGAEVFLSPSIPDLVHENSNLTLNNSRYLLVEFPFDSIPSHAQETLYRLMVKGFTPIIAHPERTRSLVRNITLAMELVANGCMLQLDAACIMGVYGSRVKKFAKELLKNELVSFVASDAHYAKDYAQWYKNAYKKVKSWVGEVYAEKLFFSNAAVLLEQNKKPNINISDFKISKGVIGLETTGNINKMCPRSLYK
ncbi:MAG: phosphoesterase [Clostridia bacterium]|nr:phosphoesterase [Clostridia bacterium]